MKKTVCKTIRKVLPHLVGSHTTCAAVILAAGKSTRMGQGISKQMFLLLDEIPTVVYSLLAFENSDKIQEIVVVAAADEIERYRDFKETYHLNKLTAVVAGGQTRAESAANGFRAVSDGIGFVAIHDAARCLIAVEDIERVFEQAIRFGAAIAATSATDTIKVADKNGIIVNTPDRRTLWLAQTPQIFKKTIYEVALAKGGSLKPTVTDDASLVENAGFHVRLVECSAENMKITRPDDIPVAAHILSVRKGGNI